MTVGKDGSVRVLLIFADHGAFHREQVDIPLSSMKSHERLVDCLREDPDVLKRVHVDASRLCAAYIMEGGA